MFNFFCNLAVCVYGGTWYGLGNSTFIQAFIAYLRKVPIFGLFNNSTEAFYDTSTVVNSSLNTGIPDLAYTIAVILSTICCIGVFWMVINAIRKIFGCFLEWF